MDVVARLDELGIDITDPALALGIGKFLEEYKEAVIEELRSVEGDSVTSREIEVKWLMGCGHDAEYEYTRTFECDGTLIGSHRRRPEAVVKATAWEKIPDDEYPLMDLIYEE